MRGKSSFAKGRCGELNSVRILVLGAPGAGKSTFAVELASRLAIPVIHLDRLYYLPDWQRPPKEEWELCLREVMKSEAWVMDGNYVNTLTMRLEVADAVILLDPPPMLCAWRVVMRRLRFRGREQPFAARGCLERLRQGTSQLLAYTVTYRRRMRPRVEEALETWWGDFFVARSRSEAAQLVEALHDRHITRRRLGASGKPVTSTI